MYQIKDFEMQKFFEEHGITQFNVTNVEDGEEILIVVKRKTQLNEYVKNHYFNKLIFKRNGETYKLLRFYVNIGGEKGCIKPVYVLKNGDRVIDVIAFHEFENSENFANPNLNLIIDEIIAEDY